MEGEAARVGGADMEAPQADAFGLPALRRLSFWRCREASDLAGEAGVGIPSCSCSMNGMLS